MKRPIAIVCRSVLSLPPFEAGSTTLRTMSSRSTVIPNSRTRMTIGIHHGSAPMRARPMRAAAMRDLSAIGSAILPKSVMRS